MCIEPSETAIGGAAGNRDITLVFQIASLGDTIVAVPTYREIARRHPESQIVLLTNAPSGKFVAAESVLGPIGLIVRSIEYPMPLRGIERVWRLFKTLNKLGAARLYYLTSEIRTANLIRHYLFFRFCGIREFFGVPWSLENRFPRYLKSTGLWESEASRLLRSIRPARTPGPPPSVDRELDLSDREHARVDSKLTPIRFQEVVAISVGGKVPINDWGDDNWSELLKLLSGKFSSLGAVFVGSPDEHCRNEALSQSWRGPKYNACGVFTPRETAALLQRACLFIGHDTSTLHLAAAVGTRVIGIFSARNRPGKWFTDRPGDIFFYNRVECMGCELIEQRDCSKARKCILSIRPEDVFSAADNLLTKTKSSSRQSTPLLACE